MLRSNRLEEGTTQHFVSSCQRHSALEGVVCSVDVFPLVLLGCCRASLVSFGIFAGKLLATKFNLFLRQCEQIRLDDTLGFYASVCASMFFFVKYIIRKAFLRSDTETFCRN